MTGLQCYFICMSIIIPLVAIAYTLEAIANELIKRRKK